MGTLVQNPTAANGSGTTVAKAFGSNVTAGNMLVAFATTDHNTTHTFSSPGDVWQTVGTFFESGAGQSISIGVCFGASGGAKTVTATFGTTGTFNGIIIAEFSNSPAYTALDVNTPGQHVTGGNPVTDASMTTTADGDLVVSCTIMDAGGVTVTAGTGFTLLTQDTTDLMSAEFQTQSSAGSIAPTFNVSTAANAGIISAAFKAGATAISVGQQSTNRHPGKGPGTARFFQSPRPTQAGNVVNIDGSLTVTANRTATVAVTHTVSGSLTVTANRTATVAVTHTVSGSLVVTANRTATIARTANINGSLVVTASRTATVAVTHNVSGSLVVTASRTAAVAVVHNVSGSLLVTVNRTATAAATHTISGSLTVTASRTATVAVTHRVSGSLAVTASRTATVAVVHTVSGSLVVVVGLLGSTATVIQGSLAETVNRTALVAVTHTVSGARPITVTLVATIDVPKNQSLFLPFFG